MAETRKSPANGPWFEIHQADCMEILPTLDENSIDSIVTDPPYGLSLMGQAWDRCVPSVDVWRECLRVLKPGGHLLAFAGTRTQHRMACAIEDAGFEIRDMIAWVYGSGFPKSQNVSKAIDKAAGAEREAVAQVRAKGGGTEYLNRSNADTHAYRPDGYQKGENVLDITAAATPEARQWNGWGTALKPALEPITVARKPLTGTVAANVQQHGTGALNIDGCRVAYETVDGGSLATNPHLRVHINGGNGGHIIANETKSRQMTPHEQGRWPANLIHDGSDEVVGLFPVTTSGSLTAANQVNGGFSGTKNCYGRAESGGTNEYQANTGSAARFFYCAKASKADRDEGLDHLPKQSGGMVSNTSGQHMTRRDEGYEVAPRANNHPTVKPTDLMRYLCRLVTPPGGTILDPFTGSGSTGKAAMLEGFCFLGIEINGEYLAIANARIQAEVDSRGP